MSSALTESFCERCGTKYTFDTPSPRRPGIARGRFFGKRDRDGEVDRAQTQLEAFHSTFRFCMECRQYTCPSCWNEDARLCQSCAPPAADGLAADPMHHHASPVAGDPAPATAWPVRDLDSGASDEAAGVAGLESQATAEMIDTREASADEPVDRSDIANEDLATWVIKLARIDRTVTSEPTRASEPMSATASQPVPDVDAPLEAAFEAAAEAADDTDRDEPPDEGTIANVDADIVPVLETGPMAAIHDRRARTDAPDATPLVEAAIVDEEEADAHDERPGVHDQTTDSRTTAEAEAVDAGAPRDVTAVDADTAVAHEPAVAHVEIDAADERIVVADVREDAHPDADATGNAPITTADMAVTAGKAAIEDETSTGGDEDALTGGDDRTSALDDVAPVADAESVSETPPAAAADTVASDTHAGPGHGVGAAPPAAAETQETPDRATHGRRRRKALRTPIPRRIARPSWPVIADRPLDTTDAPQGTTGAEVSAAPPADVAPSLPPDVAPSVPALHDPASDPASPTPWHVVLTAPADLIEPDTDAREDWEGLATAPDPAAATPDAEASVAQRPTTDDVVPSATDPAIHEASAADVASEREALAAAELPALEPARFNGHESITPAPAFPPVQPILHDATPVVPGPTPVLSDPTPVVPGPTPMIPRPLPPVSPVVADVPWHITAPASSPPAPTGPAPRMPAPAAGPGHTQAVPFGHPPAHPSASAPATWVQPPAARPGTPGVWDASTRGVVERPGSGVRTCVSCALPLSASARFCRRCGCRQT